MYIVKLKSKTESQYLIDLGCPEWVEITIGKFENLKDAAKYCNECNKHIRKFHKERKGKQIHYIKEIK